MTALFPLDVSIKEALEEAAEILGLPGPPQYDVSMTKDQDWVETIKVPGRAPFIYLTVYVQLLL